MTASMKKILVILKKKSDLYFIHLCTNISLEKFATNSSSTFETHLLEIKI